MDPEKTKRDGLAFVGLSLTQKSKDGNPDSITHQTAFDLNEVIDRDYEYLMSSNDDGWLVGGGEPGPPKSYKLAAKDSSHVEIMRIGTYRPDWGGIKEEEILEYVSLYNFLMSCIYNKYVTIYSFVQHWNIFVFVFVVVFVFVFVL